jgi:transposase
MGSKRAGRRRHSRELKAEVLAAYSEPGASVAAIALERGLNANLVHKWRREATRREVLGAIEAKPEFIALPMSSSMTSPPDIRIELRRGATTVMVSWPMASAGECAVRPSA